MIFVFDLFHLMCYSIGTNFKTTMFSEFSWADTFDNSLAKGSPVPPCPDVWPWHTLAPTMTRAPSRSFSETHSFFHHNLCHFTCELFPDVAFRFIYTHHSRS